MRQNDRYKKKGIRRQPERRINLKNFRDIQPFSIPKMNELLQQALLHRINAQDQ